VGLDIVKVSESPLPSLSCPSRLPSAADVTKAKRSLSGQHEGWTPGLSDCEHACAERAIERWLRLANFVELLSKALPVRVEVSGSRWSDSF
jgi:hypothetical protein